MPDTKHWPRLLSALMVLAISACAPSVTPENSCVEFSRTFSSIPVRLSELDPDYLHKPLPASLRKLEAGYDSRCETGGLGDVYIQCVDNGNSTSHTVIRDAPVIWTDPEGFTVLVVSAEDYVRLQDQELFWAKCEDGI